VPHRGAARYDEQQQAEENRKRRTPTATQNNPQLSKRHA
jgi:hypothetical protein